MSNIGKAHIPRFCHLATSHTHITCWDNLTQRFYRITPEQWFEGRDFTIKLMMDMTKEEEDEA